VRAFVVVAFSFPPEFRFRFRFRFRSVHNRNVRVQSSSSSSSSTRASFESKRFRSTGVRQRKPEGVATMSVCPVLPRVAAGRIAEPEPFEPDQPAGIKDGGGLVSVTAGKKNATSRRDPRACIDDVHASLRGFADRGHGGVRDIAGGKDSREPVNRIER